MMRSPAFSLLLLFIAILSQCSAQRTIPFITRQGQQFQLNGQNFNFGGANSYYLGSKHKSMVDDVFDSATKMGISVIRTWAFNVVGNPQNDSWPPNVQEWIDVYYQYWDVAAKQSKINEGPKGIENLDYVVQKARDSGVKVILVLANNWHDYGGSDQYNTWHNATYHDEFFTSEEIKNEYKTYVSYLLNRKNKYTGVTYKDEPAIFAWELMNEPRCKGCMDLKSCDKCTSCKPSSPSCTPDTITAWASEMAKFIKNIDKNHLVGAGDEGFFYKWRKDLFGYDGTPNPWGYPGYDGDHESLVKIPDIDFSTFHIYAQAWQRPLYWVDQWIDDHIAYAKLQNKPLIMEEFGWSFDGASSDDQDFPRSQLYDSWTHRVCKAGGNWMFWMLAARENYDDNASMEGKKLYPDYDKFTVYYKSADGKVTSAGQAMQNRVYRTKVREC